MSEVYEGYERQYCELSASLSRKCASASLLDGEQKKQKVSEIKSGLEDAENLIRKMDLEARSLQPNVKGILLAKLREYKSDLNNLKAEVKRITSANTNQAARDDLLESGMSDTLMLESIIRRKEKTCYSKEEREACIVIGREKCNCTREGPDLTKMHRKVSADQRGRLLMSTERLNQSSERINESRRTMLETEELGVSILQDLHQQRQSLLHAHDTLHGVDENVGKSKKILTAMSRRMNRNKCIIASVIVALILAIILILYFKLSH